MLHRDLASQALERQPGSELPDGPRKRAGRRRRLLAVRHHGHERELEQWFFRITHYADELLEAADRLPAGRTRC